MLYTSCYERPDADYLVLTARYEPATRKGTKSLHRSVLFMTA
jgi:hypothetical protein